MLKNIAILLILCTVQVSFTQAQSYCNANGGSAADEWIEAVSVGNFNYNSGNNNGYGNHTNQSINVTTGENYNLTLTPGYSGENFEEHWRVWIDYNNDGDFNDSQEKVYDSNSGIAGQINNVTFTVSNNADLGETRLRVAMKWVGTYNDGSSDLVAPDDCGTFDYGEVEDYTVNINETIINNDPYCATTVNSTASEWIEGINIGDFSYTSGNNDGYAYFTNTNLALAKGGNYPINLQAGYADNNYTERWRIWIDFNKDNDFLDSNELVLEMENGVIGNVIDNILIPNNISLGETRMRIAMKYVGTFDDGTEDYTAPNACGDIVFGEVEDYLITITNEVPPSPEAPTANFAANVTTGPAPLTVTFVDQSNNAPTTWNWTFEGGTPATSTDQNPVVSYTIPGVYAVTLLATNDIGNDIEIKNSYITVTEQTVMAPVANFTASIIDGDAPLAVTFIDNSTNIPDSWLWEFPGATPAFSNEKNPTVTYPNEGTFPVTLTVTNAGGTDSHTISSYINVNGVSSIEIVKETMTLNAYPNPVTDLLKIDINIPDPTEPQLYMYNILGQVIHQEALPEQEKINHQLAVNDLPTGVYWLQIENGNDLKSIQKIQVNN